MDLLQHHKGQGITSIIIPHKLNEIAAIADSTTIIRDGLTIESLDMKKDEVTEERIIRAMVGRDLENRYPDHTPNIEEEMFRVENWNVLHPRQQERQIEIGRAHV